MVSVSVTLYGDLARELEAALHKYDGVVELTMTATFTIHNVEGRSKVFATFTGEAPKQEKTTEQKQKEALALEAESAQLRAELAGFLQET